MSESLNYLLGNFVTQNFDVTNATIKQNSMVCVDTSNGFLGFNTIDPSYHIDVCNGTIRTGSLILNNIQTIYNENDTDTAYINLPVNSIYRTDSGYLKIKF